jgi:hypothetical protein
VSREVFPSWKQVLPRLLHLALFAALTVTVRGAVVLSIDVNDAGYAGLHGYTLFHISSTTAIGLQMILHMSHEHKGIHTPDLTSITPSWSCGSLCACGMSPDPVPLARVSTVGLLGFERSRNVALWV